MDKIRKAFPSFVTSLNMVCGVCASVLALQGDFRLATFLVILGAVFDFCDGFVARLLNATSEFGKQMDSLSDLISFGFAPSAMLYSLVVSNGIFDKYSALFVLLIAVFSGLRLAKFNVDTEQTVEFKGLPTPASALFIISVCYYCFANPDGQIAHILASKYAVVLIVAFVCVMMVVNMRLFSMKIKSLKLNAIIWQLILVAGLVVFVVCFGVLGLAFTMVFYIILSIIRNVLNKNKK
ncbi:MAG: CDP-diacylglycerol--serine O-phosphatidyltransferase [Bacteroidales bacterium]|nr:CDP-diacylglycerol--serine O-phosphatidyltransferase [Bacteroidales bacterium]